jgi:hypothetical protein
MRKLGNDCRLFTLKLTEAEHKKLEETANEAGMTRSDYVRKAVGLPTIKNWEVLTTVTQPKN